MENLGIDIKLIGSQLLNFFVFYLIFQKFISKPFLKYLADEKKKDEEKERMMKKLQEGEATLATKEKEMRAKGKVDYDAQMVKAKEQGEALKADIVAQGNKEAEAAKKKAQEQMAAEKEAMTKDIKQKVATLSTLVVTKGLQEYLKPAAQKEVTEHIITNLPANLS